MKEETFQKIAIIVLLILVTIIAGLSAYYFGAVDQGLM